MNLIFDGLFMIMLSVIAYKDYREHYIYDKDIQICLVILLMKGIIYSIYIDIIYGLVAGAILGLLCYWLSNFLIRHESLGMGDVFLLTIVGGYLGNLEIINFFMFSNCLSAILIIPKIINYQKNKHLEIPMAPTVFLGLICYIILDCPNVMLISEILFKSWL